MGCGDSGTRWRHRTRGVRDAFLLVLLLEGFWERAALLEAPCPAQLLIHFLPVGFLQCLNGCRGGQ